MSNFCGIDGSLVAFRASAAGEKRKILTQNRKTKEVQEFEGRKKFKEWVKAQNEANSALNMNESDFEVEDLVIPADPEVSQHICNEMLKEILMRCQATDFTIYLDEGKTFRHELATVQEYKGNRLDKVKPANLQIVKDHLVTNHGAKVVNKLEADDYINFHQFTGWRNTKQGIRGKTIAVTFDKDAFGNPGWIYDFRKDDDNKPMMKEPEFIDGLGKLYINDKDVVKGRGRKFLYFQILNGDTSDNYKPNKLSKSRYGEKAAFEDLNELPDDKSCLIAIANRYQLWYPEPVSYISWDGRDMKKDWVGLLQEYFDLARMRRWEDDTVSVEKLLHHYDIKTSKGRLNAKT